MTPFFDDLAGSDPSEPDPLDEPGLLARGASVAPGAGGFATVLRALLTAAEDGTRRPVIERSLQDLLMRNAAYARARARRERDEFHADRIQQLEDRVADLRDQLEASDLRLLEARRRARTGVASEHRAAQGIDPADAQATRKRELMDELFEANLELARELEARLSA